MASKHSTISDVLVEDILRGQYRAGERFPSERDLAARFDANRGAVREAMKTLEQLGLICIQPGGARVKPLQDASLDVIGHMLNQGDVPDPRLVDQILLVITNLISLAAETAIRNATPEELDHLCELTAPLTETMASAEEHHAARMALMRAFMVTSNNLVCQLIAKALFEQFAPSIEKLRDLAVVDHTSHARLARQLDRGVRNRDIPVVRDALCALSELNRDTVMRAVESASATGVTRPAAPMSQTEGAGA